MKHWKFLFFSIFVLCVGIGTFAPGRAHAAVALVAHAGTVNNNTSTPLNTTGANFLIVSCHYWNTATITVSDSMHNTWHALTAYGINGDDGYSQIFYAYNASVSSSQTFSCTPQTYEGITVSAYSGVQSSTDPFESGTDKGLATSANSVQPGSVAPTNAGDLIVTVYSNGYGSPVVSTSTVSGGFTITNIIHDNNDMDGGMGYLISTSTSSVNPTWTNTAGGTAHMVASIAAFKAAPVPVTLDATSSLAQSATNATSLSLSTFTVGTGLNRALLVEFDAAGCTPFPTAISVTWDSGGTNQALTVIASSSNSSDGSMAELLGLVAPTSGNKTLTATWTNNCSGGNVTLAALSVTGANQTGGATTFANATSSTGSGSSWSQTVTSASGDFAVTNAASQNVVPTPSNQTTWYSGLGTGAVNAGSSYASGASTVTFNYTGGSYSGGYDIVGVDIAAASGGGGSAPTVNSFSASPSSITLGSSTTLSWNVSNASSVAISGNNLSLSTSTLVGSTAVTPTATGTLTYTLSANNPNGTSTATTAVTVSSSGGGGGSTVTLIQVATSSGNLNSVANVFPSAVTAGDTLVVLMQWGDNTSTPPAVSTITDTLGNHFNVIASTKAVRVSPPDYPTRDLAAELAYATGTPGGADTVTVTFANPSSGQGYASILEISPSTLDLTAAASGTSASPSAGSVVTSHNGEFGAAALFQDDGVGSPGDIGAGGGWTIYQQAAGGATENGGEYQAQATAGSIAGNFTSSNSSAWAAGMAVFVSTTGGSSSSTACDTIYIDSCSVDYFIRGDTGAIFGNSVSTHFGLQGSGQVLALPVMTSADFKITSGALSPVYKAVKPDYNLIHYQWRDDNGSEANASSATGGNEDTILTGLVQNTSIRVRTEITNDGGTIFSYSPQSFQLQYGLLSTTCSAISSWTVVGASGASWAMYNSANLSDGANTTNIATSTGGVADANHTFIVSNGGVKTTTSTVAAVSVPSDSFLEMEFDVEALTSSTPNGTYCFRLINAGTSTNFTYTQYPEVTVASAQSISLTLNTSTVTLPGITPGVPVTASTTATVNVTGATSGYFLDIQRNSATSTLVNTSSSAVTFPDYQSWVAGGSACNSAGNATSSPGNTFSFRVLSGGTTANYCSLWWGASDVSGTALYAGVPTSTAIIVDSTSTASQNGTTTVSIMYRAAAAATQRAGGYSGNVTITAIANP